MADDPTAWLGDAVGGIAGADAHVQVHIPAVHARPCSARGHRAGGGTDRRVDSQVKLTLTNARGLLRALSDGVARVEEHAE
jgi:hypothetical protein